MEDFRMHYAEKTMDPEGARGLSPNLAKQIARESPVQSVRPGIPKGLQYVGTLHRGDNVCFDYYRCLDHSLRQEYRKKHQRIILCFREKPMIPGRRRYEKDREEHSVQLSDAVNSLEHIEFSGHKLPQSDGQAVRGMEHDYSGAGLDEEITAAMEAGKGTDEWTGHIGTEIQEDSHGRKGDFAMLPAGGGI